MTAQALRLPFAFVPDATDLLADEHLAERRFFVKAGEYRVPGAAIPHVGDAARIDAGACAWAGRRPMCSRASWDTRRAT